MALSAAERQRRYRERHPERVRENKRRDHVKRAGTLKHVAWQSLYDHRRRAQEREARLERMT